LNYFDVILLMTNPTYKHQSNYDTPKI
jgi:hypothetical protein